MKLPTTRSFPIATRTLDKGLFILCRNSNPGSDWLQSCLPDLQQAQALARKSYFLSATAALPSAAFAGSTKFRVRLVCHHVTIPLASPSAAAQLSTCATDASRSVTALHIVQPGDLGRGVTDGRWRIEHEQKAALVTLL